MGLIFGRNGIRGERRGIEVIYEDPEPPVPSDMPAVAVEQPHGWLVPPAWEFVSEVWECERESSVSDVEYNYESEVTLIR